MNSAPTSQPIGAGDSLLKPIDPARLNALADQVVVMAYDLCGFDRKTGHHAALYPDDNTRQSAPREEVSLGGVELVIPGLPR